MSRDLDYDSLLPLVIAIGAESPKKLRRTFWYSTVVMN